MPRLAVALVLLVATAALPEPEPPVPTPRGFVTDLAGVLPPDVTARIEALAKELQAKTGAEIAVLTVDTTAPLDDFTYAMRVVDAWRPGRKREDTGLLVLVAVKDRKLRVLTGYGLEGILPDGLVGQIQDEEMMPAFRAGRLPDGIERGVREFARRIAVDKGVTLTGVPPPRPRAAGSPDAIPLPVLFVFLFLVVIVLLFVVAAGRPGMSYGRRSRGGYWGGGFGGGGGGFGGGGGGFGGFGGGSFGGGGAGRSW